MKEGRGEGEGRKVSLPFFPTHSRSFNQAIFRVVFVLCSENARKRLLRGLVGHRLDSY